MANRVVKELMARLEIGMRTRRGFTLIELLIVIVIIGITSSVALLAFGDFGAGRKIIVSAENFSAFVRLLQQRAIMETNTFGITIKNEGYETWRLEKGMSWQLMPAKSPLHWRPFPKRAVVSVHSAIKSSSKSPDIIIDASGDMSAFTIDFGTASDPLVIRLIGESNGNLYFDKKSVK